MKNDLIAEHEQQQQIVTFTIECNQLHQEKYQLQGKLEQITKKFQVLWPAIFDVVPNAPEDFLTYTLVECYEHIHAACHDLISANHELKKTLVATRGAFHDPTMGYATEIEQKMADTSPFKESIFNVVEDAHTLLQ